MDSGTLTLFGVDCSLVVHRAMTLWAKAARPRSSQILVTKKVRRRNDNMEDCRQVNSWVSERKNNQVYWPWLWMAKLRRSGMVHQFS